MRTAEKEIRELLESWEKAWHQNAEAKIAEEIFLKAEYLVDITYRDKLASLEMKKTDKGWDYVLENNQKVWGFIPSNLLQKLATMHFEWVIFEDIRFMKKILDAGVDHAIEAYQEWEKYWDNLDWEKRKKEVEKIGWPYIV